jgi:hypothetical protein
MQSLIKNLIFAFSFALLAWLGYLMFFQTSDAITSEIASEASIEGAAFLAKLQELKEIQIDGTFFTDSRFRSLVDNRQDIAPEPYGRQNPFSPLTFLQTVKK